MPSSLRTAALAILAAACAAFGAQAQPPGGPVQATVHWRCTIGADDSFNVHCFVQPHIDPLPPLPVDHPLDRKFLNVLEFVDGEDAALAAGPQASTDWVIPLHTLPFSAPDVEQLLHAVMCRGAKCRISLQTRGI